MHCASPSTSAGDGRPVHWCYIALLGSALACGSGVGDPVVGYKLGFTSVAAQERFGVSGPAWGRLRKSMQVPPGGSVSAGSFSRVFVEAEIAFTIGRRVDRRLEDPADLVAYVKTVHPALELPDWRFPVGAKPSSEEIVADGVGAHRFVLGQGRDPADVDLTGAEIVLERDGREVGRGQAGDALGSPWRALLWLSHALLHEGRALEVGEVVLTGALGPVQGLLPSKAAGRYRVTVEGLGSASVEIVPDRASAAIEEEPHLTQKCFVQEGLLEEPRVANLGFRRGVLGLGVARE